MPNVFVIRQMELRDTASFLLSSTARDTLTLTLTLTLSLSLSLTLTLTLTLTLALTRGSSSACPPSSHLLPSRRQRRRK